MVLVGMLSSLAPLRLNGTRASGLRADSVSARLLVAFVLVSIAPVVVAGVLVYRAVETTLREELWQRLGTVAQLRAEVDRYLAAQQEQAKVAFGAFAQVVLEKSAQPGR